MQGLTMDATCTCNRIELPGSESCVRTATSAFSPFMHRALTNNPYRIIFVNVPVTGPDAREGRLGSEPVSYFPFNAVHRAPHHNHLNLPRSAKQHALDSGCLSLLFQSTMQRTQIPTFNFHAFHVT